jgi:hypothetical protein
MRLEQVKVASPMGPPSPVAEPKKKGLLGFGFGGKKEPEPVHEEYRARPFTETPTETGDPLTRLPGLLIKLVNLPLKSLGY